MLPLSDVIRPPRNDIKILKLVKEPHRYQASVISIHATTKPAPQVYTVKIICDTEKLHPNSKIKGYCDCHDFRYRQAYCWYINDALIMEPAFVLQPPQKTNPNCHEIRMCKHLATVAHFILSRNI